MSVAKFKKFIKKYISLSVYFAIKTKVVHSIIHVGNGQMHTYKLLNKKHIKQIRCYSDSLLHHIVSNTFTQRLLIICLTSICTVSINFLTELSMDTGTACPTTASVVESVYAF